MILRQLRIMFWSINCSSPYGRFPPLAYRRTPADRFSRQWNTDSCILEFDAFAQPSGIRADKFAGLEPPGRDEILQQTVGVACLVFLRRVILAHIQTSSEFGLG
jgi:hypothetical protein